MHLYDSKHINNNINTQPFKQKRQELSDSKSLEPLALPFKYSERRSLLENETREQEINYFLPFKKPSRSLPPKSLSMLPALS